MNAPRLAARLRKRLAANPEYATRLKARWASRLRIKEAARGEPQRRQQRQQEPEPQLDSLAD